MRIIMRVTENHVNKATLAVWFPPPSKYPLGIKGRGRVEVVKTVVY